MDVKEGMVLKKDVMGDREHMPEPVMSEWYQPRRAFFPFSNTGEVG
jgi:hypothetical protein